MTVDLLTTANYFTELMDGNLTRPNWEDDDLYLSSYSIDKNNIYSTSAVNSYSYSGYFLPVSCNSAFKRLS